MQGPGGRWQSGRGSIALIADPSPFPSLPGPSLPGRWPAVAGRLWETAGMTDRKGVAAFGAILLAHAAITTITWRDIARRADGQVRGSKKAWRIASALNTGGSLAYLVAGRRR